MDEESGLNEQQVSSEGNVVAEPTTPPETTKPADSPGELDTLKKQFEEFQAWKEQTDGRLAGVPNEDAIAQKAAELALKDPRNKQRQRDMIDAQIEARIRKEVKKRTKAIDRLETDGKLDPNDARAQRREIEDEVEREVNQEFAETPQTEEHQQVPQQPQPQIDWGAEALKLMRKYNSDWKDYPQLQARIARGETVRYNEIEDAVIARYLASEKERIRSEEESKVMKKYEEKVKPVKDAEAAGAVTPPPGGETAHRKRTLADADEIGDILDKQLFKH